MRKKYQGYERVNRAKLQALRRELDTLQIKDGESVMSYCGKVMEISIRMQIYGESMEYVIIGEKILPLLILKFDYMVCSIEESKDLNLLSLDELQSSLLIHEQKIHRSSTVEEKALKASVDTCSHIFRRQGRRRGRGRG